MRLTTARESAALVVATLASPLAGQEVGEVLQDCEVCPMMVVVPAGTFTMGAHDWEQLGEEVKPRSMTIPAPFAVGIYEVTFWECDSCVRAGGCGVNMLRSARRGGWLADSHDSGTGLRVARVLR